MSRSINFTSELSKLMKFTGLTATAIRMYSAYNSGGYRGGDFGSRHADPARSPVDLMFLADALHHFERIGNDIERGEPERIVATCDDILTIYTNYEIENPRFGDRQSKPTFELWASLVNLEDAKMAFKSIRDKASALLPV